MSSISAVQCTHRIAPHPRTACPSDKHQTFRSTAPHRVRYLHSHPPRRYLSFASRVRGARTRTRTPCRHTRHTRRAQIAVQTTAKGTAPPPRADKRAGARVASASQPCPPEQATLRISFPPAFGRNRHGGEQRPSRKAIYLSRSPRLSLSPCTRLRPSLFNYPRAGCLLFFSGPP